MRDGDLLAQIGSAAAPSTELVALEAYVEAKAALRRRGFDALETFLNRTGRSRGSALVFVVAPRLRFDGAQSSILLLRHDPTRREETGLEVTGHGNVSSHPQVKARFRTLSDQQARTPSYRPPGGDPAYRIELILGAAMDSAEQTTTITLRPAPALRAIRLALTAWMQVESVTLGADRALGWLQWRRQSDGNNPDESVLVDLGEPLPGDAPVTVSVRTKGSLFEPWGHAFFLIDEDLWYPHPADVGSASYEMAVTLPAARTAVAPGQLVEVKPLGDARRFLYRTTRPQKASSLYVGKFTSKSGDADGTRVEVYVGDQDQAEKNLDFAVVEMQNILKVYNRLFLPLDTKALRVAATPTGHGRGFDGLILLSRRGGFSGTSSGADTFRAHEVAHQWWGNVVQPDRWPRDRWLSEAFAQYAAMEYFRARFEDAKKTREQLHREWVMPLQRSPETLSANLRGQARDGSIAEQWSILDGGNNVYTKGPMVLQMLRYLCKVKTGADEAFWEMQRTFLKEFSGKPATTEDFIEVSQRVLGTDLRWFWSQWLLRTEIPRVRWAWRVEPKDGKFLLTVDATQIGTEFTLFIPVYAHFGGGNVASRPLVLQGKTGQLQMLLPADPEDVSLNDNWEALVELVK